MAKTVKKRALKSHYSQKDSFPKKPNKTGGKRKAPKTISYLTIPEKDRLFAAIRDVRNRAIFRLLYHHGLRAGEIGRLDMSDFRQGSSTEMDRIYIHRLKGSVSGECAMVPAAAQALRAWIRKRGVVDGPIFLTQKRARIGRRWIYNLMRRYCAIAKIPPEKAHPHILKHSCCTHLLSEKRESIVDVQVHVGHVQIANTMKYAKLTGEANEARAKRLREWK